jgi:hypothetical protein
LLALKDELLSSAFFVAQVLLYCIAVAFGHARRSSGVARLRLVRPCGFIFAGRWLLLRFLICHLFLPSEFLWARPLLNPLLELQRECQIIRSPRAISPAQASVCGRPRLRGCRARRGSRSKSISRHLALRPRRVYDHSCLAITSPRRGRARSPAQRG